MIYLHFIYCLSEKNLMRIAINTRTLIKDKLEGIGYYIHELLRRLVKMHPEHDFFFFFDRAYDDQFIYGPNVTPIVISPQARHPILWYIWFEHAVNRALNKYKIDLFFSPDGHLCLQTKVPTILTIHDLAYKHFPGMIPSLALRYYERYLPLFAKKAAKIITVSEFVKKDIQDQFNIKPNKIIKIYNAATEGYMPFDRQKIERVRQLFSQGKPYFFYAGAIHPRKNIIMLIKGYEKFRRNTNCSYPLILAGRMGWLNAELEDYHKKSEYKNDIVFLGRVSKEDLNKLMAAAFAFCYISKMEGFGIPIVEAMNCHIPVIASNKGSLPEVTGDAGIIVDPENLQEITDAMTVLYLDKEQYVGYVEKSALRKSHFSWDIAANELSKILFSS